MKLLIIDGTGKTGLELIKQGLEDGHELTVLVRKPHKLNIEHPHVRVVTGDVLDHESLNHIFQGQDAVLSVLGHKRFFIKTTILARGTKNIIHAMKVQGVNRLICITSLGINDSRFKLGLYYTLFTIPFILFFYFLDTSQQEKLLIESSLDWTIVRPGQLTQGKKRTNYKHGKQVGHYILTKMISRANIAHFMLKHLKSELYLHKAVGISN